MKGTRTKTSSKPSGSRSGMAGVHRERKQLCLDNLRLMKMPNDFLERIPLALN